VVLRVVRIVNSRGVEHVFAILIGPRGVERFVDDDEPVSVCGELCRRVERPTWVA